MSYLSKMTNAELADRIMSEVSAENSYPEYLEMLMVEAAKREKEAHRV